MSLLDPMQSTTETSMKLEILDLQERDYEWVYNLQKRLVEERKQSDSQSDCLIFVEHPEVYTHGRKGEADQALENSFEVERGGEATYHNPGQLVCYPIFTLKNEERDLNLYLRRLEQTIIDTLKEFGIASETRKGATGVWLKGKEKKIASIGVAASSWVTYHGLALNVSNDLKGFEKINPCGFEASVMTSMQEVLGEKTPSMNQVKTELLRAACKNFGRRWV